MQVSRAFVVTLVALFLLAVGVFLVAKDPQKSRSTAPESFHHNSSGSHSVGTSPQNQNPNVTATRKQSKTPISDLLEIISQNATVPEDYIRSVARLYRNLYGADAAALSEIEKCLFTGQDTRLRVLLIFALSSNRSYVARNIVLTAFEQFQEPLLKLVAIWSMAASSFDGTIEQTEKYVGEFIWTLALRTKPTLNSSEKPREKMLQSFEEDWIIKRTNSFPRDDVSSSILRSPWDDGSGAITFTSNAHLSVEPEASALLKYLLTGDNLVIKEEIIASLDAFSEKVLTAYYDAYMRNAFTATFANKPADADFSIKLRILDKLKDSRLESAPDLFAQLLQNETDVRILARIYSAAIGNIPPEKIEPIAEATLSSCDNADVIRSISSYLVRSNLADSVERHLRNNEHRNYILDAMVTKGQTISNKHLALLVQYYNDMEWQTKVHLINWLSATVLGSPQTEKELARSTIQAVLDELKSKEADPTIQTLIQETSSRIR